MFDLDALAAEAVPTPPFEFQFGGEQYQIDGQPDLATVQDISDGNYLAAFRRLVGEEQYARIVASSSKMTKALFLSLLEAYGDHVGAKPGESNGSTDS